MCEKQNKDYIVKDTLLQEYASIFTKNSIPGKENGVALERFQEALKSSNFGVIRKVVEKVEELTELQKEYRDAFVKSSIPGKESSAALERFQEGLINGNFGILRKPTMEWSYEEITAKAS
ncbi:hypothetical protein CACET_c22460 [Clostridium aceticum]|uniref:Uncharacterized protein n=1 Tax=Clostridium aceticum TaxID=84022 RepID=A0A0D8I907_9CLOT|nr:hypothetical protein [Clostridium aceticum]AKL95692.1 hypothetical protein CACET_c22460 [Clostridium aceticum]KJF26753.1 hypothetical protein TZ02_11035 [Clostridium aceticum]